ncbi:MAG: insulinase family protein [Oscillospiraceae bacterium]|nr:insulinase family protein [Oscillospiraceae bacterium]
MYTDFDDASRSELAAAAYVLAESCKKFPTYSALSKQLAYLYDATLTSYIDYAWSSGRTVSLSSNFLDNSYALGGENLEAEICDLLCECLLEPNADNGAFDESSFNIARAELIDDIDSVINDKSRYAAKQSSKTIYAGEPWETPPVGTHELAEKVTPKAAYNAYGKLLENARISILCSGASDFAEAEKVFTERLAGLERGKVCMPRFIPSKLKAEPAVVEDAIPMEQAILMMYFKSPKVYDRYAVFLMSMILGGMATSRFFTNIREKQSLCYYCSSSPNRAAHGLCVNSGVDPRNIERTKQAVLEELRDIQENGVTDEELQNAKLNMLNIYSATKDNPSAVVNHYYRQIADEKTLTIEETCEKIKAVTAGQIRDAAREFKLDTVYTLRAPGDGEEDAE